MFVVIERHEDGYNKRVWTGFKTVYEAGQFAEIQGDLRENDPDGDLWHYDVLPAIQS